MKRNKLNSEQISALCMELSLLVHAGVGVGDGDGRDKSCSS